MKRFMQDFINSVIEIREEEREAYEKHPRQRLIDLRFQWYQEIISLYMYESSLKERINELNEVTNVNKNKFLVAGLTAVNIPYRAIQSIDLSFSALVSTSGLVDKCDKNRLEEIGRELSTIREAVEASLTILYQNDNSIKILIMRCIDIFQCIKGTTNTKMKKDKYDNILHYISFICHKLTKVESIINKIIYEIDNPEK